MDLEKQLEVLKYLRNNNIKPTPENRALMEILGFKHAYDTFSETENWFAFEGALCELAED